MYEPEKWKAQHSVKLKAHFATYGAVMPPTFFDNIIDKFFLFFRKRIKKCFY